MTHPLGEEQQAFRAAAERFAREKLKPRYQAREREATLDRALLREMGRLGLIGADLPERHGGLGAPSETVGLIIEALAYGDVNVSYVQLLGSLCGQIILHHAADEVAAQWLPRIVAGESLLALALTEPRGGSDAGNLALSARPTNSGYVLNGEKSSISMADQADAVLVFARTGRAEDGARGVSAFLVPMTAPGVSTSRFNDLGSKVIGRGSIFFDGVEVPRAHRLGDEGAGFIQVMQGFDFSRALIGLQCVAAAQASLDETWVYVQRTPRLRRAACRAIRASPFRSPSTKRWRPRCASFVIRRCGYATPGCRIRRKRRCANGSARRRRSTPSTNAC